MTMERFKGRSVLVTGGASGIGRCTALRFAEEGAAVVAVDVNAEALAAVAAEAGDLPGSIVAQPGDVSTEDGARAIVSGAVATLGALDVLVNVAGILSFSHSHEETLEEWNRILTVNLTGTFLLCRESLPHLLATKGNIVNLASTASHAGQPWAVAYCASKGGVLALSRELAVEYAEQGLRCNTVSPGAIDTPITLAFTLPDGANPKLLRRVSPLGPFGTPEGIAAAIAFIASDEASHMNGADVRMDGATLS
jgi:meso-butanediol dehydrogenase/(S,S)-butanediol dehydrogenase/diacetyl reductase